MSSELPRLPTREELTQELKPSATTHTFWTSRDHNFTKEVGTVLQHELHQHFAAMEHLLIREHARLAEAIITNRSQTQTSCAPSPQIGQHLDTTPAGSQPLSPQLLLPSSNLGSVAPSHGTSLQGNLDLSFDLRNLAPRSRHHTGFLTAMLGGLGLKGTTGDLGEESQGAASGDSGGSTSAGDEMRKHEIAQLYNEMASRPIWYLGMASNRVEAMRARVVTRRACGCSYLLHLVNSRVFTVCVVLLIMLNAIFIAFAADFNVRRAFRLYEKTPNDETESERLIGIVDTTFVVFFAIELCIRLVGLECGFWFGSDWKWNLMDLFLVMASVGELLLEASGLNRAYVRTFRLLRIMRSIRVIRVLRFFRELRMLLLSVFNSIVPLAWSLLFLALVLFVFVVVALQGVTDYVESVPRSRSEAEEHVMELEAYFPGLIDALITHFAVVTGGINWWGLSTLLFKSAGKFYGSVFIMFVILMVLMTLNIITGIFVNNAVELAQMDRDFVELLESERIKATFSELKRLFLELDEDDSGAITLQEFEIRSQDPKIRTIFNALEIELPNAIEFFKLLDVDGSNELEIDEFVVGCMGLKGAAKTVTIELMMKENKRMMRRWQRGNDKLFTKFRALEDRMVRFLDALERSVHGPASQSHSLHSVGRLQRGHLS